MSVKNIFANGILVDLKICKWTAEKQLTAEDLGIDPKKLPNSFTLGKKFLIPKVVMYKFHNRDSATRRMLETKSYPFAFGEARFLPKRLFTEFSDEFDQIKLAWDADVVDLIQNFPTYKRDMQTQFIQAAKEAYERIQKIQGACDKTEDVFINEFLERIEKQYPAPSTLLEKFDMSFAIYQMEIPDLTEATINDVAEENEKLRLLQDAYQKKFTKALESYAEKMLKDNRDRVTVVLDSLKETLSGKRKYSEKTANFVNNMITDFIKLDIVDDVPLKAALQDFKAKYIDGTTSKMIRNDPKIQKEMLDQLTSITGTIMNAAELRALADSYRQKVKI
jgi:predicted PolB exonuclease-like 3'-5' exonuclease